MGRDGEVLGRRRSIAGFRNHFDVPEHLKQPGWSYQWNRASCYGKPDPANMNSMHENGWRAVADQSIRTHYAVPKSEERIEFDGLVLCERPQQLTDEALVEHHDDAVELRQAQAEQFGKRVRKKLPKGFETGRVSGDGEYDARPRVKREGYERAPVSALPKRELAVGDED